MMFDVLAFRDSEIAIEHEPVQGTADETTERQHRGHLH